LEPNARKHRFGVVEIHYFEEFEPMPTASQRSHNLRSDTQRMIDGAMALAASFAGGRKEKVAIKLREAADATYDFGQSLDDLPHMRGYVEEAAHALAGLGDYVADVEIANMVDDLQSFARRRPALAFGAALLAGVAASRLIQSDGLGLRQEYGRRGGRRTGRRAAGRA
jgi:hypothetical protein